MQISLLMYHNGMKRIKIYILAQKSKFQQFSSRVKNYSVWNLRLMWPIVRGLLAISLGFILLIDNFAPGMGELEQFLISSNSSPAGFLRAHLVTGSDLVGQVYFQLPSPLFAITIMSVGAFRAFRALWGVSSFRAEVRCSLKTVRNSFS